MNYELAKKLKDAGFTQSGENYDDHGNPHGDYENGYMPTLSELIEACGGDFKALLHATTQNGPAWYAYDRSGWSDRGIREGFKGETPDIAVANLWLAINEKKI